MTPPPTPAEAVLTGDEAETLRVGVNVLVRAGDVKRALTPMGSYAHSVGRAALAESGIVAPQDWVALTGPCPTCGGQGSPVGDIRYPCPDCRDGRRIVPLYTECPTCNGGGSTGTGYECPPCGGTGQVITGRGRITVIPVYAVSNEPHPHWVDHCIVVFNDAALYDPGIDGWGNARAIRLSPSPLPVPGRDWGIVIDCVEVA